MEKKVTCQFCFEDVTPPNVLHSYCPNCNAKNLFYSSYSELLANIRLVDTKAATPKPPRKFLIEPPIRKENVKKAEEKKNMKPPTSKKIDWFWVFSVMFLIYYFMVRPFFSESPKDVVEAFLENLADEPMKSANLMSDCSTESVTKFVSDEHYGGIVSVKIIELKEVADRNYPSINNVYAIYEADDPTNNGLRRYEQVFRLEKINDKLKIESIENKEIFNL